MRYTLAFAGYLLLAVGVSCSDARGSSMSVWHDDAVQDATEGVHLGEAQLTASTAESWTALTTMPGVALKADDDVPRRTLGVQPVGKRTLEKTARRMQEVPDYMIANYTLSNCEQTDHCGTCVRRLELYWFVWCALPETRV